MKAIILAAGQGKRLGNITKNTPKCLLKLDKKTILNYQIDSLIKCGIDKILVVTGFKEEKIVKNIRKFYAKSLVISIYNDYFDEKDNAYSLSLALEFIDSKKDIVIILDGDIVFDIRILEKLKRSDCANVLVAEDRDGGVKDEDCKVLAEDNYINGIGKKVAGQWVYSSMIKVSGNFLAEFKNELAKERTEKEWYSEPLDRLLKRRQKSVYAILTDGLIRCEIDTKEDLVYARKIFKLITK